MAGDVRSLKIPMAIAAAILIASAALGSVAVPAAAQDSAKDYPSRPITLVVPFAPGGSTTIVARIVGDRLAEALGQQIIIDNRPGAGGNTGTLAAAKATPDGYTLVGSGSGPIAANKTLYRDLGYDPEKDFEPVSMIGVFPIVIVASTKLPVKTLAELIAYAKERPNELNYGSVGIGSSQHLSGAYFEQVVGAKLRNMMPFLDPVQLPQPATV